MADPLGTRLSPVRWAHLEVIVKPMSLWEGNCPWDFKHCVLTCLWLVFASSHLAADPSTTPDRPNADVQDTVIPISLGIVPGCSDSSPKSINNGIYPHTLVIGAAANCPGGAYPPHIWHDGEWSPVAVPADRGIYGGWVGSISDDSWDDPSLIVEFMFNGYNAAWVKASGQAVAELPMSQGRRVASAAISAGGQFVVGGPDNFSGKALRWTRDGPGWALPEDLGIGGAVAVSEDGQVVAGNYGKSAWVWTAGAGGGGTLTSLGGDREAFDLTHDGDLIVGSRTAPCKNKPPGCTYPIPVYWVADGNRWVMHDLQAIDDVDSRALAVAKVGDMPVIAGSGYTNQDGGILRPVVWIPASDGSYGAPLRLQPLGGAFQSWATAVDINRNGVVLGWSDRSETDWTTTAVIWQLFESSAFRINAGIAGAWYEPSTAGQGLFIDVEPSSRFVFMSWFTYTDAASENAGQQYWFTAQGQYEDDTAELVVYESLGGRFDDPQGVDTHPVGKATLRFLDCKTGEMSYAIDALDLQGSFTLQRVIPGSETACELQAGSAVNAVDINAGMDGAWYEPATAGQGLFIDARPDSQSGNFIFVGWFTYGDATASGQRWLTAQGSFDGPRAVIDIHESTGGSFAAPGGVNTHEVGTMTLEFQDCGHATLDYFLTDEAAEGTVELSRVIPGTDVKCMGLAGVD